MRFITITLLLGFSLMMAGCASVELAATWTKKLPLAGGADAPEPRYKVGDPYSVSGVWYYPERDLEYDETGIASWYADPFTGRPTANGEIFDPTRVSAAHKTLPLPSVVRVTNLENGRSIAVRVNDRGPFVAGRIIDLSEEAARVLGFKNNGIAKVRVQILVEESLRLEREAKDGRFPKLNELSNATPLPKTNAASVPTTTFETSNNTTSAAELNNALSAINQINSSRSVVLVTGAPVATSIWVQAGAFNDRTNALLVKRNLKNIGEVKLSRFDTGSEVLHRVRIGPVQDVAEADRLLLSVIGRGYPGAKIILE